MNRPRRIDWLCFDGNLMAPDGTEPWWPADHSAKDG